MLSGPVRVSHVAARFWPKVQKTEGCWNWIGALSVGYGVIGRTGGGSRLAHRVSWELLRGPIPDGLHLDHLCRNPRCVNPDHLEPVTPRENTLRGFSPGAVGKRTNTCKHGHSLENAHIKANGCRLCKECDKIRHRRYYQEKKKGITNADGTS